MSNKKEKQHFVPKFYLSNFSWEGNRKQIGVFNIKNKLFIPRTTLRDQAYKKNYYGKDGTIEDILSKAEGECAALITKILLTETLPERLSGDHNVLLFFALLSELRNPMHENGFKQTTQKAFDHIYSKATEEIQQAILQMKNSNMRTSILGLSHLQEIMSITFDLKYKILINNTDHPFITSDNPAVKYNCLLESKGVQDHITSYPSVGLLIFLPLDSNRLVVFYDGDSYDIGVSDKDSFQINDSKVIDDLNILHFLNCEDSVFFNDEVDEDYIKSLFTMSQKFERANEAVITEHPVQDEAGRTKKFEGILIAKITCCRTGLNIPFIKFTKKGKNFDLGDRLVHMRPLAEEMEKNGALEKLRKERLGETKTRRQIP